MIDVERGLRKPPRQNYGFPFKYMKKPTYKATTKIANQAARIIVRKVEAETGTKLSLNTCMDITRIIGCATVEVMAEVSEWKVVNIETKWKSQCYPNQAEARSRMVELAKANERNGRVKHISYAIVPAHFVFQEDPILKTRYWSEPR